MSASIRRWCKLRRTAASANFGQIVRTSTGSRVIPFALKFNF
jgi:hypothetical protein